MGVPIPSTRFSFQRVREIGRGGFGVVEEVVVTASNDPAHHVGMRLACKRLGPQWANDPQAVARFDREVQQLQRMDHPHIVRVEGVSLDSDRYYVMRLYPGTLRAALEGAGAQPLGAVLSLGLAAAMALTHAHGLGIVHRDLKPENILLTTDGRPVIADWGLGQFVHKHSKVLTRGGLGTEWYCPLEQWSGQGSDERADVYALGIVLGELLVGKMPLQSPCAGIQQDLLPRQPAVSALLRSMTALRATDRPFMPTVAQQIAALVNRH